MIESSALLVKLRWEQQRLLSAVAALETHVAGPFADDYTVLTARRWEFARELILHFDNIHRAVLHPLMEDSRPGVAERAARSSQDLVNVFLQFQRHIRQWQGVDAACWCSYREALSLLMRRVRVRLAAQETELYPLLSFQPGGHRVDPAVAPLDYAAAARDIRSFLHSPPLACSAAVPA